MTDWPFDIAARLRSRARSRTWRTAALTAAAVAVALSTTSVWGWQALRLYERHRRREAHRRRDEQPRSEGVGPLYVRRYSLTVDRPQRAARAVMQAVMADLDAFSPEHLARFEKVRGAPGTLAEGDAFYIHLRGPWNGPVRAVEVGPTAFTLATLQEHMEAGRIRFAAEDQTTSDQTTSDGTQTLHLSIVSCARSSDRVVDLFYDKLGLAREVQEHMWTVFLERIAERSGGTPAGPVEVDTWSGPMEDLPPERAWAPHRARLARIPEATYNYDPSVHAAETLPAGWHEDAYEVVLPAEAPGPPEAGGAWDLARAYIEAYRFPDPRLIRGYYDPDVPLADRAMVLEARFLGFRFLFDVRIEAVLDETRETPDGPVRVWGYSYRTLEGHFERGEIFFEVWKEQATGHVAFKIRAQSSPGAIPNLAYRLGFRLFGRMLQRRFAHRALGRVAEHVRGVLARQACERLGDADREGGAQEERSQAAAS